MNNNNKIKIAIVGVGNCASSLVQGLQYYKDIIDNEKKIPGLMHPVLGEYKISDICIVAAFDVDRRKVGVSLSNAIFAEPNCTKSIWKEYCFDNEINDVIVEKVCPFDGICKYTEESFLIDNNQKELNFDDIVKILKDRKADIIVNYLPVGTQIGTDYWTDIALLAGCAFINCIPVFVASNNIIAQKFKNAGLPVIGDDIKSEMGSTIVNRTLVQLIENRGGIVDNSWQLNVGGNTDFQNMLDPMRLTSKKISKTESVSTLISNKDAYVNAGPNGYIECLNDNKVSFMRIDFRIFGNVSCSLDVKLNVEDSPNSAGCVIDAIRLAKIALDRGVGGALIEPSAWLMKHPPQPYNDDMARKMVEEFIRG